MRGGDRMHSSLSRADPLLTAAPLTRSRRRVLPASPSTYNLGDNWRMDLGGRGRYTPRQRAKRAGRTVAAPAAGLREWRCRTGVLRSDIHSTITFTCACLAGPVQGSNPAASGSAKLSPPIHIARQRNAIASKTGIVFKMVGSRRHALVNLRMLSEGSGRRRPQHRQKPPGCDGCAEYPLWETNRSQNTLYPLINPPATFAGKVARRQ